MSDTREELERELTKLLSSVRLRLSSKDDDFIAELIDNREYALALEVTVDAFAKGNLVFTRAEIEVIEALARKMDVKLPTG